MSDKQVGRSPQPQDPERAAGKEVVHTHPDQAALPTVPEARHGDKSALLARFREREEKERSGAGTEAAPVTPVTEEDQ